jgi:hypothetical protein
MGFGLKGSSNFHPFKDSFSSFFKDYASHINNECLEDFTNLVSKLSQWIVTK